MVPPMPTAPLSQEQRASPHQGPRGGCSGGDAMGGGGEAVMEGAPLLTAVTTLIDLPTTLPFKMTFWGKKYHPSGAGR